MRALLRTLIIETIALTDLIPAERWKPGGSIVADNIPERKFAVIRFGTVTTGLAHIKRVPVSIWIHDDHGSYGEIDAVLKALTDRLDGVEQQQGDGDVEIISIEWDNNSGDLYDPGYRTITKNWNATIIGKGL